MRFSVIAFTFIILLAGTAYSATNFPASDPVISSPQPSTVALSWTKIDGAKFYNVEWDFYGSMEFAYVTDSTSVEIENAPPGVLINYQVSTRVSGTLITSPSQAFQLDPLPIDSGAQVNSVSPPSVVQIDSSHVYLVWDEFQVGTVDVEYLVEQFINGDWVWIAVHRAEDGSSIDDRSVTVTVVPGLPHFFRVSRNGVSSPSTVFATTSEDSTSGFTQPFDAINIQSFRPSEATYVNSTTTIAVGKVDEFYLGESGASRGFVRYDLSEEPSLNLCDFLYARLVFDMTSSNVAPIPNNAADGSSIRTYASLTSTWTEASVTIANAPSATDVSLYLSDTQVVQFEQASGGPSLGDPTIFVPLDRTLSTADNIVTLLNDWRQDPTTNNGLMLTASGSLTATLELPVPDLQIVSRLNLAERSKKVLTVIPFGDVPASGFGGTCSFSNCGSTGNAGSVCSFSSAWADGIRALPSNLVPSGSLVISMEVAIYGGAQATSSERLTVSVSGAAVGDIFLSGSSLNCASNSCQLISALSSPQYPPEAGGWPNFDTAATENNEIKIFYEGDICVGTVELVIEYLDTNGDPNCPSPTPSPSVTPTTTRSVSRTPSSTRSASRTPSSTTSLSSTNTATATPTPSSSSTRTPTTSGTATASTTQSASTTRSASNTPSNTVTPTTTLSQGVSPSSTPSNTPTASVSPSTSPTSTSSRSNTPSSSTSQTPTSTSSGTATGTPSNTPSTTRSASSTATPTVTSTSSPSPTATRSPSSSRTASSSLTSTRTPSRTASRTASTTRSAGSTPSQTPSNTPSSTPSRSSSSSRSRSSESTTAATQSSTPTVTPLGTKLPSFQQSPSPSSSGPPIIGPDPSPAPSVVPSRAPLPSATSSPSRSQVPTVSVGVDIICALNPSFCEDNDNIDVEPTGSGGGTFVIPDDGSGGVFVAVPPNTLPDGSVVVVSIPNNVPETDQELSSVVVDITVFNLVGGELQPTGTVEICLESTSDDNNQCLGFLDTSIEPAEWRCEDKCPTKRGRTFCGETDHFTNFALLLGGVGADECASDESEELIFDAAWKDGVLVASVTLGIGCICLVILVLLLLIPGSDRLVYGKEGMRVKQLRSNSLRTTDGISELLATDNEVEELV